jgi:hypothetical protein
MPVRLGHGSRLSGRPAMPHLPWIHAIFGVARGAMSSSAGQKATGPAAAGDGSGPGLNAAADGAGGEPATTSRPGSRLAAAALLTGLCGFSGLTIIPGLVLGVLGLRRGSRGRDRQRCWAGIGAALGWAVAAGYLVPHLAQAADPGCTAYKGPALAAYERVIDDFNVVGQHAGAAHDLGVTIGLMHTASARSASPGTARALAGFAGHLQAVLSDIRDGHGVPEHALTALNRAAARADQACGTV